MKKINLIILTILFATCPRLFAQWSENGSSIVYTTDKAGIGTDSPTGALEIENLDGVSAGDFLKITGRLYNSDGWQARYPGIQFELKDGGSNQIWSDEFPYIKLNHGGQSLVFASGTVQEQNKKVVLHYEKFNITNTDDDGNIRTDFHIDANGQIGIGTDSPGAKLDVRGYTALKGDVGIGDGNDTDLKVSFYPKDEGISPVTFYHGRWNGAFCFKAPIGVDNVIEYMRIRGDWTKAEVSIYGNLLVQNKIEAAEIEVKQNVITANINTQNINAGKLNLQIDDVADYVFEENYNLRSLEEVETYVKTEKHLPEIPSANEMETEGMNVAEMNNLLLKKVEELTLYTIEQEKRIKELEVQNKKIEALEKIITRNGLK